MSFQALLTVPESVNHAANVIASLDRCFLVGFGRLGPEQHAALQSLVRICSGTPLEAPVSTAVDALGRSEFIDRHFVALAAARAALQAAQYDALRAQLAGVLGRPVAAPAAETPPAAPESGPITVWQESARNWLMELALAGFQQLEASTLSPFLATLEHLQGEPRTIRLASLLTGYLNELLESLPIASLPALPIFRWCDLWTRAMLAAVRLPAPPVGQKVSGTLTILGADLRQHGFFVSCDVYGILDGDTARLVRVTTSSYKVSVLSPADLWCCFPEEVGDLLRGVSQHLTFQIDDMTLLPGGDLLWDGKASPKKPVAVLDVAAKRLAAGAAEAPAGLVAVPVDRHPVHLAELVHLGGYAGKDNPIRFDLGDGVELPVALDRHSAASEIQTFQMAGSNATLGLLRFDAGQWQVQPLAVSTGKKNELVWTGRDAHKVRSAGSTTLKTLKERASRLLRAKK